MEEMSKHGKKELAAMRAGMGRETGRKYRKAEKLPSQMDKPRHWRTRKDPFAKDWSDIAAKLKHAPELEAKILFEDLMKRKPERYEPGQLRTFQRRVLHWRATQGPDVEVFFPQVHRPGEAMQTDFTSGNKLGITIQGEPFDHLLCHPVLPYSNWEAVTVCRSESMAALRRGVQHAVFKLGRVPQVHQTDNTTAATHDLRTGMRGFNDEYVRLMDHLGMKPRTIQVGKPNQNGDSEALNGAFKRRLEQHLLLRDSRDFDSVQDYERWVQDVAEQANSLRRKKVAEEIAVMRPLSVQRLPEYHDEDVPVSCWCTIRVKHNTYSVPSRLKNRTVRVRVYDDRLEVYYAGLLQFTVERLLGRFGHRINYRHVIWSLMRKPWAFARYRYREDLFPTPRFRQAYDRLQDELSERDADLEYLRILHRAATTMESEVDAALSLLLEEGEVTRADAVKRLVVSAEDSQPEVPKMAAYEVDLGTYDGLLSQEVAS